MKKYIVIYIIKANRTQNRHSMVIEAANKKTAESMCKTIVFNETGRNAFTPEAHEVKKGLSADTIITEQTLTRYYEYIDFLKRFIKNHPDKDVEENTAEKEDYERRLYNAVVEAENKGYTVVFDNETNTYKVVDPKADL